MTNNANTVQAALNMQWEKWRDHMSPMKHNTLWIGGSILAQCAANSKREPQIRICSARLNACLCVLMLSSGLPPLLRGALLCTSSTSSVSCLFECSVIGADCASLFSLLSLPSLPLSFSLFSPPRSFFLSLHPDVPLLSCTLSHSAAAEEHNQINLSVN